MYSDFATKYQKYLKSFGAYLLGDKSAPTFDTDIDFSYERNHLQNATSAETLIQLTHAMYHQVAAARTLKEIYKKPSDYFTDYKDFLTKETDNIDFLKTEVQNQTDTTISRMSISKTLKGFSSILQKKLSLINPKV